MPDYDMRTEPIDAEAIMRLWIADGAIDASTVPHLDVIRAWSTSSSQPIRPRPSPALQRVDELEVILVLLVVH
jgi:hypothetical protein